MYTSLRCTRIFMACLALICSQVVVAQQSSGSAFGESVDLDINSAFSLVTVEAESGPIPSVSGSTPPPFNYSDSLLGVDVNANVHLASPILPATLVDILSTGILEVSTNGNDSPSSNSSASVADVELELLGALLLPLIVGIEADAVTSTATAGGTCESGLTASGTSGLANATLASALGELAGITGDLDADPAPNTVLLDLDLLGGHLRIVLNEQIFSGDGVTSRGITVNAIHITLEDIPVAALITDINGDVIISQSTAQVTCSEADLSINKADSADPVLAGQPMSYTLTIENAGPDSASNVLVEDVWPATASFTSVDSSQGSCDENAGLISCNLGTIASGGNATVTIYGTPLNVGILSNTATVSSDAADPDPDNNEDTEETTVNPAAGSADLSVEITDSPDPVTAGSALTITLDVANNGPNDATGTLLVYEIPAGVLIDTVTPGQGSCEVTASHVNCSLGTVGNGATPDVVIVMTPTIPTTLEHIATVSSNVADPVPDNNSDNEFTVVEAVPDVVADLSIVKTDSPDPVIVDQPLTYTLTVANNGPNDTAFVVVTDVLPAGLIFESAVATQGGCEEVAGTVTCNLGAINNGAGAVITLVVIPTQAGEVSNTATVTSDVLDDDLTDNASTAITTVEASSELPQFAVTKYFADGNNETPVTLTLHCDAGSYAPASVTVAPNEFGLVYHSFVVYNVPQGGIPECTVTEEPVAGYAAQYWCPQDDSDSTTDVSCQPVNNVLPEDNVNCRWVDIQLGESNSCVIVNEPEAVEVEVTKVWDITNQGGADFSQEAEITIYCDAEIVGGYYSSGNWRVHDSLSVQGGDYDNSDGEYVGIGSVTAWVIPQWYPEASGDSSGCWAEEQPFYSAVEVESDCGSQQSPGMEVSVRSGGDSCTITNTLFFEGIPALSTYGKALLLLLLLGVGLIAIRRGF